MQAQQARSHLLTISIISLTPLAISVKVEAIDREWVATLAQATSWADDANWQDGVRPSGSDGAFIDASIATRHGLDYSPSIAYVRVTDSSFYALEANSSGLGQRTLALTGGTFQGNLLFAFEPGAPNADFIVGGMPLTYGLLTLDIEGSGALRVGSGATMKLAGPITGASGQTIEKTGAGTLILAPAASTSYSNDFGGVFRISSGTVQIGERSSGNAFNPLGSAVLEFNGGTLRTVSSTETITLSNTVRLTSDSQLGVTGGGELTLAGPMSLEAPTGQSLGRTLTVNNSTTVSGVISNGAAGAGVASIVKAGAGVLSLSGSNTYSGTTDVSEGTLVVNHPSALGMGETGGTQVRVSQGACLSLRSGAGTLTDQDKILRIQGNGSGKGALRVASENSTVTWGGKLRVRDNGGGSNDTDASITFASGSKFVIDRLEDYRLSGADPARQILKLSGAGGTLAVTTAKVHISIRQSPGTTYNPPPGTTRNTTTDSELEEVEFVGADPDDPSTRAVVQLVGSTVLSNQIIVNSGVDGEVNTGSYLCMVAGPITGSGTLYKTGSGTLRATRAIGTGIVIDGGKVEFTENTQSDKPIKLTSLTLAGGSTPTAMFDVANGSMIVGSSTSKSTIEAQVAYARNGGSWNGNGITSSAAASASPANTGLGVLSGAEYTSVGGAGTFGDQSYSSGDTLVKYTYNGDANFSGTVNFDDYVKIDIGYSQHYTGWLNGDFNYSGAVNFDDYVLIDYAYATQGSALRSGPRARGSKTGTWRSDACRTSSVTATSTTSSRRSTTSMG